MKKIHAFLKQTGEKLQDLSLLLLRLVLAYGFYEPALSKWSNLDSVTEWFASMNYPFPLLNAYLTATVEAAGVVLLLVGFATRIITPLLMFVMIVAITTVHLAHGFSAGNNGFEIPLYYFVMLLVLFAFGPGKYSFSYLFCKKK